MSITFTDITTGEKEGRGYFDELMRTTLAHIVSEHTAGRITDANYATVYLSAMQSNLSAAVQFGLQQELTNAQIEIALITKANTTKQGELLDAQILQIQSQTALTDNELSTLRPEQLTQLQQQVLLLTQQVTGQTAQNTLLGTQNAGQLLTNANTTKEGLLIDEKVKSESAATTDFVTGQAGVDQAKTSAEKDLLAQKLTTEVSQVLGQTTNSGGSNYVTGLVGAEIDLKTEQKESFKRDAEQKAAKFYSDLLSIVYSTNPDAESIELWGFSPANSYNVMTELMAGIGVTAVAP